MEKATQVFSSASGEDTANRRNKAPYNDRGTTGLILLIQALQLAKACDRGLVGGMMAAFIATFIAGVISSPLAYVIIQRFGGSDRAEEPACGSPRQALPQTEVRQEQKIEARDITHSNVTQFRQTYRNQPIIVIDASASRPARRPSNCAGGDDEVWTLVIVAIILAIILGIAGTMLVKYIQPVALVIDFGLSTLTLGSIVLIVLGTRRRLQIEDWGGGANGFSMMRYAHGR